MNAKLEKIAEVSADNLKTLFSDLENEIQDSIAAATENAEAKDSESVVLNITHAIKLDLSKDKQTDTLRFNQKHEQVSACEIGDPNQADLDFSEGE